jgi:uncharacterized repeat protein (TIGR04076 family)
MAKVKITVVKLAIHSDLVDKYVNTDRYPSGFGACSQFGLGQQFTVEGFPQKPADFPCDWAWSDIQRDVALVMFGGNLPWMADKGKAVTCCSDGFRPVSFLLERIEELTAR